MIDPLFCWAFFCLVVLIFELLHQKQMRRSSSVAAPMPDPVVRTGRADVVIQTGCVLSQGCGR